MSRFMKLVRDVLNNIPDEKNNESIWDQPAKTRTEQIGESLSQIKSFLEEKAEGLDAKWAQSSASSIEISALNRQHNEQNRLLNENYDRFQACKRIWIADESRSKLDSTVQRAYFGSSGIRFYIGILQENAARLDPGSQNVDQMVVLCYNSAISPMIDQQQKMETKCAMLEAEIRQAGKKLADSESLHRALGYTPCGTRLRDLKTRIAEGTCDDPDAELQALKKTLDANKVALEKMVQLSDPMPEPAPLKNAALRADLAELLDEKKLEPLRTPGHWTPESYAAGIRAYITELETGLLKRYLLPGEKESK